MLKDFRDRFGLSQTEAADILGYSLRTVQYIESGERFINPKSNPDFFVSGLDFYSKKLDKEKKSRLINNSETEDPNEIQIKNYIY